MFSLRNLRKMLFNYALLTRGLSGTYKYQIGLDFQVCLSTYFVCVLVVCVFGGGGGSCDSHSLSEPSFCHCDKYHNKTGLYSVTK